VQIPASSASRHGWIFLRRLRFPGIFAACDPGGALSVSAVAA